MTPHYAFDTTDHYAFEATALCFPSLSFKNGGHTTSYTFPSSRSQSGPFLHRYVLRGENLLPQFGEVQYLSEVLFSSIKGENHEGRIAKLNEIGELGFLKIFKEIDSVFGLLKQEHEKTTGVAPAACVSLWRTRPVIFCADYYSSSLGPIVGYSTFGLLSMIVADVLPDECEGLNPVPLPSYVNPGLLLDVDIKTAAGRRQLAEHARSGVKLAISRPI